MTVFYFIDGDAANVRMYTNDSPWTLSSTQTISLFGMVGGEFSPLNVYAFEITQPHFVEEIPIVPIGISDSVSFEFADVLRVNFGIDEIEIDTIGLSDEINLSFI
jgi:hypothetical protein